MLTTCFFVCFFFFNLGGPGGFVSLCASGAAPAWPARLPAAPALQGRQGSARTSEEDRPDARPTCGGDSQTAHPAGGAEGLRTPEPVGGAQSRFTKSKKLYLFFVCFFVYFSNKYIKNLYNIFNGYTFTSITLVNPDLNSMIDFLDFFEP